MVEKDMCLVHFSNAFLPNERRKLILTPFQQLFCITHYSITCRVPVPSQSHSNYQVEFAKV